MDAPKPVYDELLDLVKDKDYFVLTTNVDHCFQKAGFEKHRLFYTQGDYGLFQCSKPCHPKNYENEEMVKTLRDNFIKNEIPLDYIHLDIHYMDGYRDFTIDKTRFPDIKKLSEELKKDEIELVGINDAAIKEDPEFDLYKYL